MLSLFQTTTEQQDVSAQESESEDDCEDIEQALKKEVDSLKNIAPREKRFQNVATKAKNLVFIRTTLDDTVKVVTTVMEDIALRKLKRARYAARMLPIVGTCKAQTAAIAELAKSTLSFYFSQENPSRPASFTVMFKARNNNGTTCGKESVIPAIKHEILKINPDMKFSWSEFDVAVLVEIVCTTCCLGLAPGYDRLRKFNFQELAQGPRTKNVEKSNDIVDAVKLTYQGENKAILDREPQGQVEPVKTDSCKAEESEHNEDLDKSVPVTGEKKGDRLVPSLNTCELKNNLMSVIKSGKVGCVNHSGLDQPQSEIAPLGMEADGKTLKEEDEKEMSGLRVHLKDNNDITCKDNDCSTATDNDCSTATDNDCSTPTDNDCSTPTDNDCSTPTDNDCSTPTDNDCSTPTDKPSRSNNSSDDKDKKYVATTSQVNRDVSQTSTIENM